VSIHKKQTSGSFISALEKIGNLEEQMKILRDLAQLEEVADDIRSGKTGVTTLKVKKMKKKPFWQLSSGDYRIWYDFDENGDIFYLLIFRKVTNKTPRHYFNGVKTGAEVLSAQDLDVKVRLEDLEDKKIIRMLKRQKKRKQKK